MSCRSNRRRILNEAELVDALRSLAEVDVIEFAGMSFYDQVSCSYLIMTVFSFHEHTHTHAHTHTRLMALFPGLPS